MAKYYLDIENEYLGKQKTIPLNIKGYEEARVLQIANMNDGDAVTIKIAGHATPLSDDAFITAKFRDGSDMVFTQDDNVSFDSMAAYIKAEYEGEVEEADNKIEEAGNKIRVIFN